MLIPWTSIAFAESQKVSKGHPAIGSDRGTGTPARERRRHPRRAAVLGAWAVMSRRPLPLDNLAAMSLGEIAMTIFQSRPAQMGQIVDIGPGGMAFDCVDGPRPTDDSLILDLVFAAGPLFLSDLPYRRVAQERVNAGCPFEDPAMCRIHLRFPALGLIRGRALERFIENAAVEDRTWKSH